MTLIPRVKASAGNTKMVGSSLGNAPLCQNLRVLRIANALQRCSYVEERKKAHWFWLVANQMSDAERAPRAAAQPLLFQPATVFGSQQNAAGHNEVELLAPKVIFFTKIPRAS